MPEAAAVTGAREPRYLPAGESALVVEFGQTIDPAVHDLVLALDAAIAAAHLDGVTETVPSYRSLMIHFNPRRVATPALIEVISHLDCASAQRPRVKHWRIPICYDAPFAEDLGEVAARLGLQRERIIDWSQSGHYRVYMYGFAPGFTFLGGLPDALAISRREAPRAPAPPGSLTIAGGQALIASVAMPTSWYQIGRTPAKVFDSRRERPFLVDVGDEVSFERIDAATFAASSVAAESGALVAHIVED
jgi:inhibitor of KinA